MSTVKLLRVTVTGPAKDLDAAICALVLDREFHPLPAVSVLGGKLKTPEGSDPCRAALDSAVALMNKVGLAPEFREFRGEGYTAENCEEYVERVSAEGARLVAQKNAQLSLAADDEALAAALMPYYELDTDLGELLGATHMDITFGTLPPEQWAVVEKLIDPEPSAFVFRTGTEGGMLRCGYAALPDDALRIAELMREYGFQPVEPPKGSGFNGVPARRIEELRGAAAAARESAERLNREVEALKADIREELLRRYSYLRYHSEAYALRTYAGTDGRRFCLMGWIPEADKDGFAAEARRMGCTCDFERPDALDATKAPVKLKAGFFSQIFLPFVEMYGYPVYGEANPSIFMLITYCLLFGIMFGDVGQGAVLVLAGLYMFKKRGMWLGRIVMAVGCSAIVFGFVYGSVFGNEHLLPGFKVLEEGNAMTVLLLSAGVGCVLIVVSAIFNIVTGFRQRDYHKALFSANGITGVLFLVGLVGGAVCTLALDIPVMSSAAYWVFLALMLLCVWFGEPLGALISGHHEPGKGLGMVIGLGFFDLFEALLSWMSNCLSFLRVGAYSICHVIMMLVVYTLAGAEAGEYTVGGVIGLVFGNILVMVLEAVLVCIQTLRLEFYELFGRFYTGRGMPFRPVTVDYSDVAARAA